MNSFFCFDVVIANRYHRGGDILLSLQYMSKEVI